MEYDPFFAAKALELDTWRLWLLITLRERAQDLKWAEASFIRAKGSVIDWENIEVSR